MVEVKMAKRVSGREMERSTGGRRRAWRVIIMEIVFVEVVESKN